VNDLVNKAKLRKQEEASLMFGDGEAEHGFTLLELKVLMSPLLAQICTVARVCLTSHFIRDI